MVSKEKKKQIKSTNQRKRFLLPFILLICVTSLSLYYRSANNQFLDLDDTSIVVKNYPFLKNISNAPKAFTQGVFQLPGQKDTLASYYRPVMTLSFMMDAQLSPAPSANPSAKPFLKANIFYHTLACILLLLVLLEFNILPIPSLLLTMIFAVHPLLNQAVAWIPGRNDSLLAIFILLSLLFLLKYRKSKQNKNFIWHIVFFVFALFTKENAVMFIPIVFLLLWFVYREPIANGNYKKLGIAYLLCITPWILIRQHALAGNNSGGALSEALHLFISNIPYYIQYTGKAIFPFNLSVMSVVTDTNYIIGLIAIAMLTGYFFLSKEKNSAIFLFGVLWFLLFLTPSFFSGFSGLEHRAYLPLAGVIISVSQFGWIKHANYVPAKSKGFVGFIILCGIFIAYYIVSFNRLPIFQNKFNFDKSAVETSQSALPSLYLAKHYEEQGDSNKVTGNDSAAYFAYRNAISAYYEALKRDTTSTVVRTNIAGDYLRMNMYKKAEKELKNELQLHPKNNFAVFDMGLVIFQYERKDSEGVALWKKTISLDSSFAQPYKVLFQYYQGLGDSNNTILYRNLYYKKRPIQ